MKKSIKGVIPVNLPNVLKGTAVALLCVFASCSHKQSEVNLSMSDKYEGKTVELIEFADSMIFATGVVEDGKLQFLIEENDSIEFPLFAQVAVDGKVRAYCILEGGKTQINDSTSVATGSPLNDQFAVILHGIDSVSDIDDMNLYVDYVEKLYNEYKDTPFRDFLGVEWLKYAAPERVDSFMNVASSNFRGTRRVRYYENFAKHRAMTSPGNKYVDFKGENSEGRTQTLSSMIVPGHYTLIDFWASWCPYCIKDLPELFALYNDFNEKGLDIIGVAVRDKPEDTRAMVEKKEIPWKVLYNTQKIPYDIYGFSGIPHMMLLDPNGVIVSRGENVAQIRQRLEEKLRD